MVSNTGPIRAYNAYTELLASGTASAHAPVFNISGPGLFQGFIKAL